MKEVTWVMFLGSIGNESLVKFQDGKFMTTAGDWYDIPSIFSFRGSKEDCKNQLNNYVDRFFAELEKEFPEGDNQTVESAKGS